MLKLALVLSAGLIALNGAPSASAAVFTSVYTGVAEFHAGASLFGRSNSQDYDFTSTFTYDTGDGSVVQLSNGATGQRYDGPVKVVTTIDGLTFSLDGSSASSVQRSQTPPTQSLPFDSSFAYDQVFTGPNAFTGDYIVNQATFLHIAFPPSVTTQFVADFSGLGLDNLGSFSLQGGQVTGQFAATSLVVSAVPLLSTVPLPASLPLFGFGLLGFAAFGYVAKHRAAKKYPPAQSI